jgi:hypothetical protein
MECHFHNASNDCFRPKTFLNFMHGFKSAILAKLKNWSTKSRIYAGKSTKKRFSKKALTRIEKLFLF